MRGNDQTLCSICARKYREQMEIQLLKIITALGPADLQRPFLIPSTTKAIVPATNGTNTRFPLWFTFHPFKQVRILFAVDTYIHTWQ